MRKMEHGIYISQTANDGEQMRFFFLHFDIQLKCWNSEM